ncbi:hypothetical protein [Pyxidicoccus sp. MSG2]|uniref:hypothetical protein n=1 Tax=Pyxidicoccus sp. MSG2 TaxID=2996790 RepID=UPI00227191AB|nr:hypothetical protein [Pyxidicoccus sp. MSG2]MCY1021395.1 hypothetical protein [Pyxidicoccus sp. MSG2]
MSSKTSVLEPLRVRIRRLQFIMGLGFIALIVGRGLGWVLIMRLTTRIQELPFAFLQMLAAVALVNLWLLVGLPLLCYGAARVIELRPWTTALGASATGLAFILMIDFVQGGADALWEGGLWSVLNVVTSAVGVVLSARAVVKGRAAAAQQVGKAQAKAQERKSEYDEFLRAAEAGAARLEQREAEAQQAQATEVAPSPDTSKTPAA